MLISIYFFLSFILVGVAHACLFDECDHPDFGSCGNACCRLNIYIPDVKTVEVMNKLRDSISSGGPDNLYISMPATGDFSFTDLRHRSTDEHFLGQASHTTEDKQINDTLNLLISSRDNGRSTNVMAFSMSQTSGVFSDGGQNYYNLYNLFEHLELSKGYKLKNADSSCSRVHHRDLPGDM